MQYKADTPEDYISQLPEERQEPIKKLDKVIREHMPEGLEAGMGYGMLAYFVPKSVYPPGYHCKPFPPLPFINVASQKNFIALYHSGLYAKKELYVLISSTHSTTVISSISFTVKPTSSSSSDLWKDAVTSLAATSVCRVASKGQKQLEFETKGGGIVCSSLLRPLDTT